MSSNTDSKAPSEQLLLLDSKSTQEPVTQIAVGGNAVSLVDTMGPTVVNSDGTLSKIANWPNMTPEERARTLRVLGARNKLRLSNEEKKQREGEDGATEVSVSTGTSDTSR